MGLPGSGVKHFMPLVGWGDFNVISNEEEKFGGLDFDPMKAVNFNQCISACALSEIRCMGSRFTWWNGRVEEYYIFKRLDRVMCNQNFWDFLLNYLVTHLIRQGSDHALLHLVCNSKLEIVVKPFKFLNYYTKHSDFKKIIKDNWRVHFKG